MEIFTQSIHDTSIKISRERIFQLSDQLTFVAIMKIIFFVVALFFLLGLFLCNAGEITYQVHSSCHILKRNLLSCHDEISNATVLFHVKSNPTI